MGVRNKIISFKQFESKEEQYDNSNGAKFWGDIGAGILVVCNKTKRILVSKRSKYVNEPGCWGVFGGKLDNDEIPEDAARREFIEETKYKGEIKLISAYIFKKSNVFTYYNFIGIVKGEFNPVCDWETESTKWYTLQELLDLKHLHFGLKELLKYNLDLIKSILN